MAKLKRQKFSEATHIYLVTQVDRLCPLCGDALFYKKGHVTQKKYEIAHIYPLNPTSEELELLEGEERLSSEPNDVDNLIPLCPTCHTKFDKPRTLEEYRCLVGLKNALIQRAEQQELQRQYALADDIGRVVEGLYSNDDVGIETVLGLTPKPVEEKFDETMPHTTSRKIKHDVADYFQLIRQRLACLEAENPNVTNLISAQVRTYYLALKNQGLNQQEIFQSMAEWIFARIRPKTFDAAQIVASFFVQNCEIFE